MHEVGTQRHLYRTRYSSKPIITSVPMAGAPSSYRRSMISSVCGSLYCTGIIACSSQPRRRESKIPMPPLLFQLFACIADIGFTYICELVSTLRPAAYACQHGGFATLSACQQVS